MFRPTSAALFAVAVLAAGCRAPGTGSSPLDLDGRPVDPFERPAAATVLLFVATDCPISNRYAPEVRRLHAEFQQAGVALWLVYPNAADSAEAVRRHLGEYGFGAPALCDPAHALVQEAGATRTPEAAVFDAGRKLVYRGRIDDSYVAFGRNRAAPTRRDLREAVGAALGGASGPLRTTEAIGCTIAPVE